MNQVRQVSARSLACDLYGSIYDYRTVKDPAYCHIELDQLLHPSNDFFFVSGRLCRKVYAICTPFGKFFLKFSPLRRKKDQRRFLLLPWRITTEWRNLSKLKNKGMSVPQRVLFGYKGRFPNRGFFLVTENVKGACIDCQNHDQIFKLAKYLAKLHAKGVFHRDIHPENVFVTDTGELVLLDVQEIYCLPYLPYWLKVLNIGKLWWHIRFHFCCPLSLEDFLSAYNAGQHRVVSGHDITKVEARCQKRYFQSRSKRCCKNSTEFQIIKDKSGLQGFKRRDFLWKKVDLEVALDQGKYIKRDKIIAYGDVCVKIYNKQIFHKDRCLTSWKMARALSVRGINVPKALAYYSLQKTAFFLSVYYRNSMTLNIYFNKITGEKEKKAAMRRFADWLKRCHDLNIWQRDFKSSNVLVQDNQFIMIDLEGVRICRNLSWRKKIINLAQLNASMSNHLTLKDRLLFFHFYCRENLPSWKKRRWAYYKIWKISECKNTLPFGLDLKKLKENSLLGTHV